MRLLAIPPLVAAGGAIWSSVVHFPRLVKLGVVAPFGRYDAETGYAAYFGARLAVREWNQGPYRAVFRIELLTQDDLGTSHGGALEARKMVADPGVIAVLGHPIGEAARAASGIYQAAALPFISLAPGMPSVDGQRTWDFLADVLRPSSNAIDFLRDGGQRVDAVALTTDDAARWLDEHRSGSLLLAGMAASPAVVGALSKGIVSYALTPVPPLPASSDAAFGRPYRQSAERRDWWFSAVAYDATRLALRAIGRAYESGRLDRLGVADALTSADAFDGVTGPVRFDATGRRRDQSWYLYRLAGEFPGELIARCPATPATPCAADVAASEPAP